MRSTAVHLPRPGFWRILLAAVLAFGAYATWVRFTAGLGASTNLSDEFPWGLWIGFDILCGVALAAGGFTISAVVYVFHIERFKPIIRPAILTAFLGYSLVILALFFDLGRGDRIWHPLIMWNPDSVMFEIGWCVALYSTVLALEFSPILFEKFGWRKSAKLVHTMMLPLVILGVVLSTLHQSSLGSLYLIVPGKLHPLWYSPLLPVFFFVSAVALGCAMTIFESFLSYRAFRRHLELDILQLLGKVIVVVLSVYLVLRVQDLLSRGAFEFVFATGYESRMFQAEIILGVVGPIFLLLVPAFRKTEFGLFAGSLLVISGFMMNRLNVSITGMEASAGMAYHPNWMEIAVSLSLAGLGFLLFALAVKYLQIFPRERHRKEKAELPVIALMRQPLFSPTKLAFLVLCAIFALALGLAYSGVRSLEGGILLSPETVTMSPRPPAEASGPSAPEVLAEKY